MGQEIKIPAKLSIKNIYSLFIYYFILLILTVLNTIYILYIHYLNLSNDTNFTENFNNILSGCISFSICASCIYYIRKLYKLSLANRIEIFSTNNADLIHIGTLCYFIIRPWFAGVFSIILFLGLNSGILIVSGNNNSTNKLMDLYIFLSFFVGFSSGKFLHYIENKSGDIIDSFSNSKSE
ncbi:hypothetical protein [Clostridium beijerinckii]|uniref:hypothetical protein n=1 Tax=Clostridium beijerinckii TaxID=1520 RepID=UPI00098C951B|nr:hypothetical protein [Clostridium beijerinckii]NRT76276.1 hypothetical protein [Clostridium beijerinckii]OOM38500.1 hypothetical protein CBEIJ_48360 [Clostridium beijerinckii]